MSRNGFLIPGRASARLELHLPFYDEGCDQIRDSLLQSARNALGSFLDSVEHSSARNAEVEIGCQEELKVVEERQLATQEEVLQGIRRHLADLGGVQCNVEVPPVGSTQEASVMFSAGGTFAGPKEMQISCIGVSADGHFVALAGGERVWLGATDRGLIQEVACVIPCPGENIVSMTLWDPDESGAALLVAAGHLCVGLHDLENISNEKEPPDFDFVRHAFMKIDVSSGQIVALAHSRAPGPVGMPRELLVLGTDGINKRAVEVYDLNINTGGSPELLFVAQPEEGEVVAVSFAGSPTELVAVACTVAGSQWVYLYALTSTGQCTAALNAGYSFGYGVILAHCATQGFLAVGTEDGFIRVYPTAREGDLATVVKANTVFAVASHVDVGGKLDYSSSKPIIKLNTETGEMCWAEPGYWGDEWTEVEFRHVVQSLAWGSNELLAVGGHVGIVLVYRYMSFRCSLELVSTLNSRGNESAITALQWVPGLQALVAARISDSQISDWQFWVCHVDEPQQEIPNEWKDPPGPPPKVQEKIDRQSAIVGTTEVEDRLEQHSYLGTEIVAAPLFSDDEDDTSRSSASEVIANSEFAM